VTLYLVGGSETAWSLKMMAVLFFEPLETTKLMAQRLIPEDLRLRLSSDSELQTLTINFKGYDLTK
jgi:hypothetical protein